ncbi:biopolymer transport protein exbD1 [Commensalibacter intestini A911]|uniref:Biopolymer transport protein exbD1 n=1 Tax=Commensalibacter intestini A911 TaxID=1088868 RepID=G6F096_9PROT|nr:biopolymer transporter ExbD [Commensalibacter intestini]EHD13968.1 biopolymer transport protein exbD1 [Commensalibacter intestini A911]
MMDNNTLRARQQRRLLLQKSTDEEEEVIVDINTTPLIDVMLVLLVMLIITIPLQTQSVQLALGRGEPTQVEPPPSLTVAIDFDNTISFDNQTVANEDALQQKFKDIAAQPDQPTLFIKPNRLASYKVVAVILADAQRLGVKKIGIMGQN